MPFTRQEANGKPAAKSFFHALLLAGVASVIFMLIGLLGADPICRWLGSDAATHDKMVVYCGRCTVLHRCFCVISCLQRLSEMMVHRIG